MSLENAFHHRMIAACEESFNLGYSPTRMYEMLKTRAAVSIAKEFVASGKIHDGLTNAVAIGRPDLAMESIMLENSFKPLFTKGELDAATWRLQQAR